MTKQEFAAHVRTKFRVHRQDAPPLELELDRVEDGHSTPTQEQFSLFFYGPQESNLGQGTFELEHEHLGRIHLFLVPTGTYPQGLQYEAVFNRFL